MRWNFKAISIVSLIVVVAFVGIVPSLAVISVDLNGGSGGGGSASISTDCPVGYVMQNISSSVAECVAIASFDSYFLRNDGDVVIQEQLDVLDKVFFGNGGSFSNGAFIGYPIASLSANYNGIAGLAFKNKANHVSGDILFALENNQGDYLAPFMPSSGNTQTLFGMSRGSQAGMFLNALTDSDKVLVLGTVQEGDVVIGTENLEKVRVATNSGNTKLELLPEGTSGDGFTDTSIRIWEQKDSYGFGLENNLVSNTFHIQRYDNSATPTPIITFDRAIGNVSIKNLSGTYTGGSAYVCVDDNGVLFTAESGCP